MKEIGLYAQDEVQHPIDLESLTREELEGVISALHQTAKQYLPLWELEMISTRLKHVLQRAHCLTLTDVQERFAHHGYERAAVPGMGPRSYQELRTVVRRYGMELPEPFEMAREGR